jgi:CysZ protein
VALLIAGAVTFSLVATIVASPFNDFLAEAAEPFAEPPLPAVVTRGWRHQLRLLRIDLLKSALAGLTTLLALLLAWVPGLNLLVFALAFLMVTFQFISYPQTRRGVTVRGGLAFLWRHAWACAGFGLVISALFSLPLIASLALPLAVVGGTLLVARATAEPGLR